MIVRMNQTVSAMQYHNYSPIFKEKPQIIIIYLLRLLSCENYLIGFRYLLRFLNISPYTPSLSHLLTHTHTVHIMCKIKIFRSTQNSVPCFSAKNVRWKLTWASLSWTWQTKEEKATASTTRTTTTTEMCDTANKNILCSKWSTIEQSPNCKCWLETLLCLICFFFSE